MKIAIVNTHFVDEIGGSQLQCDIIADELQKRGYDVTYVAIDKKTEYERSYKVIGVKRESRSIASTLLSIKPDILYWRFNKKYFYKSVKSLSRRQTKIIFAVSNKRDIMAYNTRWQGPFSLSRLLRFMQKNLISRYNHFGFKFVDALTVNNEDQLHLLDTEIAIKRYIPNAVLSNKKEFSWEKPYVLWVANIKKRKRPEIFVKLSERFKESGVDFLMIGKPSNDQYRWIIESEQTPANLHYLGPKDVEVVNAALAKSLFLVTTSTPDEGFSNNIIQAWTQKKAVLAYEFDPEGMIREYNVGFVSDSNFEDLVNKTQQLIKDSTLRDRLGKQAYSLSREHFSTEKTVDKLESLIRVLSEM
ncbi:glycosyltransferase family 4 protein [Rhodohalobacter sulfatireducens]|uniref:Glycosyltransferase family 4 protein n=1 Tax=Rhodohalobacter sulfatireducens TaxID=2911366 RepID=A0ABS9KIX8_9BACT|nr:glycosyltransferase family 4 protein [Rhodohalobacter sulfatireducens]MCG2590803.1 glycosyltransferase family 4 protein [Rhodohalobacter sulfatireducens]